MDNFDHIQRKTGTFGTYQMRVFLATQLGYLVVTGSLLTAIYDTLQPDNYNCTAFDLNTTTHAFNESTMGYRSLLYDLQLLCSSTYLPTLFSTAAMFGGVCGSVSYGYLADRFGRKSTVVVSMSLLVCLHLLVAALGHFNWFLSVVLTFLLGLQAGGFMVVNLVLLLECIADQRMRLGAVAFNGWPLGLIVMAAVGYLTQHWRWFHVSMAGIAVCDLALLVGFCDESPRWLVQHGRTKQALVILERVARVNGQQVDVRSLAAKRPLSPGAGAVVVSADVTDTHNYTYWDLTKNKRVLKHLLALTYSWLSSAIISFAIYHLLTDLSGNRFLNTALTGLFKGATGVIPFAISGCVGRKPILMTAICCTVLSCWAAFTVLLVTGGSKDTFWLTVFSVMGAAAIDPIWKVNHLYSSELFPTVVRNMARAVCNLGSRSGSLIGPQVAYLGDVTHASIPYAVFGVLAAVQLLVCGWVLPESKGLRMPDALYDELRKEEDETDNQELNEIEQPQSPRSPDSNVQFVMPDRPLVERKTVV